MFGIEPPRRVAQVVKAFNDYGMLGAGVAIAAIRHPDQLAVIDENGELTYRELDDSVNAIATVWLERGLKAGDGVAIMARNHRGFLQALFAAARCGARIVLMNTGFSGPQVREVSGREGVDLFVYDEEFEPLMDDIELPHGRFRAWVDSRQDADDTLDALIASTPARLPPKPARAPRLVILTSGTTGTPKGAGRDVPLSLSPIGGPLSKVPFRSGDVAQISAPMFHALGFTQGLLQIGLGATLVLQRRFAPTETLDSLARNRVTTWVIVPVMLQRVLALDTGAVGGPRPLRAADHLPERLAARHRSGPPRRSADSVPCFTTSTAPRRSRSRRSRRRPIWRSSRPASAAWCAAPSSRSSALTERSCQPVRPGASSSGT